MKKLWPAVLLSILTFTSAAAFADSSLELAKRVAASVGIDQSGKCSGCHATNSRRTIERWANGFARVRECQTANLSPVQQLACISQQASGQALQLRARQLGFYSAALHLEEFQTLLRGVYGEQALSGLNEQLQDTTLMPLRNSSVLTAAEFADLSEWLGQGMPHLDALLMPAEGPITCETGLSPAIKEHLLASEREGWQSRNQRSGMLMFGCHPTSGACFEQMRGGQPIFPELNAWKTPAQNHLRQLFELKDDTQYWIRSSADGRFVGYGGSPSGMIDLQSRLANPPSDRVISVKAYYDPSFFPDDAAFVFQGRQTGICNLSLLRDPTTKVINFAEDACSFDDQTAIPLYQSVGASLDGSDYLAVTGEFVSDPGNGAGPEDFREGPTLRRSPNNELNLFPILYDGQRWSKQEPITLATPWELDWGIAPSNRLLVSRLESVKDGRMQHIGYNFHQLSRDRAAAGEEPGRAYQKSPLGSLCVNGLKGNFSYDDRFFVTYGYIHPEHFKLLGYASPQDPGFKKLLDAGTANVFLFDLLTQKTVALTHMGAGQFALFPHFRSDGWIYMMVLDTVQGERRFVAASDAAVKAKRETPTANVR